MRIAINVSPLSGSHQNRGVGSYTKHLLWFLKKIPDLEVVEITCQTTPKNVDLFHVPFFDFFRHSLPIIKSVPTVVTIHDVTPLIFPNHYPQGIKGMINLSLQRLALLNINGVITDSNYSKLDIVKQLNIPEQKIFPIHLAPDEIFQVINEKQTLTDVSKKYNLPKSFAIYVGDVNWNKNLVNIAKACIKEDLNLVCVGESFVNRQNLNHPEMKSFSEFISIIDKNEHFYLLGYVPNNELVALLNQAVLLIFPSFYEGFGLPILEAQACGLPVLTSNISSPPEISGAGALFVDPYNLNEIALGIRTIIYNRQKVNLLKTSGFENVKNFSWEKVALQTLDTYKKILEKK